MKIVIRKYSLTDNAQIYLNESLKNAKDANKYSRYWIFAIIHIVQAIELLCKELLRREHSFLIFDNIDNPKNTVTFKQAIDRLQKISNIEFDAAEFTMLNRAYDLRNQITHHEFDFNNAQFADVYRKLYEFITYFYENHFHKELHESITKDLFSIEAEIISRFKHDLVEYQGSLMSVLNPIDIVEFQKYDGVLCDGRVYQRIRFGDEGLDYWPSDLEICGDCGVRKGQYHTNGCDIERCPICKLQFLSCDCSKDEYVVIGKR